MEQTRKDIEIMYNRLRFNQLSLLLLLLNAMHNMANTNKCAAARVREKNRRTYLMWHEITMNNSVYRVNRNSTMLFCYVGVGMGCMDSFKLRLMIFAFAGKTSLKYFRVFFLYSFSFIRFNVYDFAHTIHAPTRTYTTSIYSR